MACRNCGVELAPTDRYCPWCGTEQAPAPAGPDAASSGGPQSDGPGDSAASDAEIRELRAAVDWMVAELARLSLRLSALERRSGSSPAAPPPVTPPAAPSPTPEPPASAPPAAAPPPARAATPARPVSAGGTDVGAGRISRRPAPPAAGVAAERTDGGGAPGLPTGVFADWNWEWLLGGNWLARIGVVALIFGVAFFISLAIDRGWLGETERALLGLAGGLALLGAGEYCRKRYAVWAQAVTGGGIAILYLSVYGAFALYGLISTEPAFGAFALITLAGAGLSLRHEAMGVAVLSIFGGFATPLLLQERLPDQRLLLVYVLVLDVGVLALAGFRNWRWFTLLGWAGSLILFAFWRLQLGPSVALAQVGLTAIFLIFAGATVAFHVVRRKAAGIADLALVTLNAAGYYGISYFLIYDLHRPWMGGFTALVGVFYLLLAAACRMRGPEQLNLTLFPAGLAVVFGVLAVPIQFGGPWISVAWGIQGLVLMWLSFPLRMRELRWAGYAMFLVSAVWLLAVDSPGAFGGEFTPFLNEYLISYAAAVILPALGAWLLHRRRGDLAGREQTAIPVFALRAAVFAAVAVPVQLDGVWIVVGWAVETVVLLGLSFLVKMAPLRWLGYMMFATLAAWLFAVDSPDGFRDELTPFLNDIMLTYGVVMLASALSAWLLWAKRDAVAGYEQAAYPVFAVGAAAVAAVAIPMQLEWPWIIVAWAAESLVLLRLSFALPIREIRWFGYVVFAACCAWLLAWDTPRALRDDDFPPLLNWYMLEYGAAVLASAAAGWLLWLRRDGLARRERAAHIVFAAAAGVLAAIAIPAQLDGIWISVAWAAESAILMALSAWLRLPPLRWCGYGLLAVLLGRLLAVDTFDVALATFRPVLNGRFLAFVAGIAALYSAWWLAFRLRGAAASDGDEREIRPAFLILVGLANLATLWIFSAEILAAADSAVFDLTDDARENLASLGLSLLWGVYAAALIALGVARRWRWVRVAGLTLLAVPVVKLFAYDSRTLEQEYRVIAFLALGLILLAGGLLYQRYSRAVRGFLFE